MPERSHEARHLLVEGRVQGVGYRDYVRRRAARFGLSGWVRNLTDGRVEALAQGAPADLERLVADMRRGPPGATIIRLTATPAALSADLTQQGFVIRATR